MSIYDMVNGENPSSAQLLQLLGMPSSEFGRFRDVYVEDNFIVVHTRCGGGNREAYTDMFDRVSSHTWYSHDADSDFDSTYADIYFLIPDDEVQSVVGLLDKGTSPEEKWNRILNMTKKLKV
jgi:hypothetical protein